METLYDSVLFIAHKTHLPHTRFIFLFPDSYGRKFGIDDEVEFHLTT